MTAVLRDIESKSIDAIICLGDIVGYYPDPESCVELVQKHAAYSVAGNHDYAAIGRIDHNNFTFFAFIAMEWTRKHLSDKAKEYLKSLPIMLQLDKMFFTHSSPSNPKDFTRYVFPDSDEAIFEAFSSLVHKINFIGHTHWPSIMLQDNDKIILHNEQSIDVDDNHYYLVNVGSVGQPRNFDSRSCYAVYDTEERRIALVYVEYDYTITQKKVISHNLPSFLAYRLAKGR